MAFTSTRLGETNMSDKRVMYGKFTNNGTSGTLDTGLHHADCVLVQGATAVTVSGGTATLTLTAGMTDGFWLAFGAD